MSFRKNKRANIDNRGLITHVIVQYELETDSYLCTWKQRRVGDVVWDIKRTYQDEAEASEWFNDSVLTAVNEPYEWAPIPGQHIMMVDATTQAQINASATADMIENRSGT